MSLCDRLGGENAIKSVVEQFYSLMLADPRVSHYF
jgi:truncated hemoglobin YjbI